MSHLYDGNGFRRVSRCDSIVRNQLPFPITMIDYFSETVFADPDGEEEELATSLITIGTCNGEICFVFKPGGSSINDKQFGACLKLATSREKSICQLISSIMNGE